MTTAGYRYPDGWVQLDSGHWSRSGYGEVVRLRTRVWYGYPAAGKKIGPYRTLRDVVAAVEAVRR